MELFVSTYRSKIDNKSRVSIPAAFRAVLLEDKVFAYCSLVQRCITVCTNASLMELHTHIEQLDMFSAEREAISTAILGSSEQLNIDAKGRICLSERLIDFASIGLEVAFVGKGRTFDIWDTNQFATHAQQAREYAVKHKLIWGGQNSSK